MIKFDERNHVVYSNYLRKVVLDLIEETNYSDETVGELELPEKTYVYRKRHFS